MKRLGFPALALVVLSCLPQSALAWNATGHELVAGVAWDNMSPDTQQKAIALLKSAPKDACLLDLFPGDSRPLAERQREFFMRAATWPDVVKSGACTRFNQGNWHFADRFWKGVSGGTGSDTPTDDAAIPMATTNAVERLTALRGTVNCDTCGTPAERATQLAWILHLTGDIHQPLHAEARVTAASPQGDRGGNDFLLAPKSISPLHTFWDRIIDNSILDKPGEKQIEYLDRVIAMIVHDHPKASEVARLKAGDFEAWSIEGFETAKSVAYPASLHEKQTPATAYKKQVFSIADEAIAIAGYRLADLLDTTLGAGGGTTVHTTLPSPAHIVIVIEENKSFGNVIGSSKAPFINNLASRGASLTKFFASHHPSQPNYIDFFAGDTLGVCKDECPIGPFTSQNLGAALIAAGKSFAGFAENLPASDARTTCGGTLFVPKHCPWVDFTNVPASASKDFSQFPHDAAGFAALPDVSFVIPNLTDDMHSGSSVAKEVSNGDAWLKTNLSSYADWAEQNNSLLIVTWDEDSSSYTTHCPGTVITTTPPKNRIPTIVMGQPVAPGTTSAASYSHQDLLRTLLDIYGIAPFGAATTAKDITDIWK
ncbi:MAG TPA: S1/P1 nuclease [Thermoanaerobaculia bacterium]|jgi:acid phosphatase|nr:S1/P1 nuclease [Thermoanaerobaculia bacterium]